MPTVIQGVTYYNPTETAEKLNTTVAMVRYWRNNGRIEGTWTGNGWVYTEEQIKAVDTQPMKRGPKTGAKGNPEKSGGENTSVMLRNREQRTNWSVSSYQLAEAM